MDLSAVPNPDDFTSSMQSEQDKGLLVKFYMHPREMKDESAAAGRPVFRDTEYISILVPGSRSEIARRATAEDKARFAAHYEAFKRRQEMPDEGTPLMQWPPVSRAMVEQLAFFNIKTVEQLANIPDSNMPNIMGLGRLKQVAQQYLAAAAADAPLTKLQSELEERDIRISAQENTITALTARLTALEAQVSQASNTPPPPPLTSALDHAHLSAPVPTPPPEEEVPLPEYASILSQATAAVEETDEAEDSADESDEKPRRRRRSN